MRGRQIGRLRGGNGLKLRAQVLDLVGVVFGDLASKGAFDLVRRRRRGDAQRVVKTFHRPRSLPDAGFGRRTQPRYFLNSAILRAGGSAGCAVLPLPTSDFRRRVDAALAAAVDLAQ